MRIVSGIQPTGSLHLGNYLGAIRNWVRMQDTVEDGSQCLFFLADLHAISMPHSPAELKAATLEMAAALVACGIDPERSILSSTRHKCPRMPSCNGCSTAPPAWAG